MSKRMDSWLKVGSFNKKDEYYTPAIMVYPIIEYLKEGSTIWRPFDTEKSEFVKVFTAEGFKVIHSHIWEGKDFFTYEPSEPYDYIISNSQFTVKLDVLRRLYELNKPFAKILGLPILNYQEIGEFFLEKNLELLIFDKKVSFDGNTQALTVHISAMVYFLKVFPFITCHIIIQVRILDHQVWQHNFVEKVIQLYLILSQIIPSEFWVIKCANPPLCFCCQTIVRLLDSNLKTEVKTRKTLL